MQAAGVAAGGGEMTPYARRSDSNQQAIIDALRAVGASVTSLHRVGHGIPDLLCGYRGFTYLLEVKNEDGKLTKDERQFIDDWDGLEVAIVRTVEDALKAIGAI